ncbi:MAG TPA: carboxypeptidase regulatory-like domain-containing protein [Burkholderiaceae bacterium]
MSLTKLRAAVVFALIAGACAATGAAAQEPSFLPQQHQVGDVRYRSGGIGLDESLAMREAAKSTPLTLLFATRIEAETVYTSAARVTIRDGKGKTVLEIEPDGPLLLLDLAPGKYTVEAAYRQQVQTRKVAIEANKHKQLVFVWKEQETD